MSATAYTSCVTHDSYSGRTADALYFGASDAAPHFVALKHDDPKYKYFFWCVVAVL